KASDKEEILKLADTLGIPYPKSFAIKNKKDLEDGAKVIGFPAVLKPTVGIGAAGVKYVEDFEELLTSFYENSSRWDRFLLQEMLPHQGEGYGVSLLFDKNSNPVASFVHKRLREYPITGGPSTLRESVYAPKILEMGITVLKALNWYGVAMVEFKKDIRDNTLKLIEVNPRFWGSLQLAILSGVDFPYLLFLMAKNQLRYHVHKYKAGVRCRWLLPGDILHFIKNPKRFQLKPSFFSFFDKTTGYDILSLKDPLPVLARLITPITFLYDTNMKQLLKRR
ncbi:MAG: ATP-grasp domain-containing protein, partial [Deltaproteobacteria bacterium]|nr:ATP-grasp domain-containing protein [Deltaproteobacteria bacterium]